MSLSPFLLLVLAIWLVVVAMYLAPVILVIWIAQKWRRYPLAYLPLVVLGIFYTYLYIQG